jgi:hypothetical protein
VKVVCAVARPLPNARATATIAKEILRAFMVFSLQLPIVGALKHGRGEGTVNKKNLSARMGKRNVSQRIAHETTVRARLEL